MDRKLFIQACSEGAAGIEAALLGLHRDYGLALLREACASLGDADAEAAQDLAHETLIRACRSCASLPAQSDLLPWLLHMQRRAVVERLRKHAQVDLRGQALPGTDEALRAPGLWLQDEQIETCWRACARRFAQEQPLAAAVMRWVAEDDLSLEQIGELLQCTPSATGEFISQCRRKAGFYFGDWYALLRTQPSASS